MNRMLWLKLLAITVLTIALLVALQLIDGLVSERQRYRDRAVDEIADSYAGPQSLVGPVLIQPFTRYTATNEIAGDGKPLVSPDIKEVSQLTFPTKLTITGKLTPSERHHGLYRAAVYVFDGHLTGSIDAPEPTVQGKIVYDEPYLAFSLSDVRGIIGLPAVKVNGVPMTVTQGGVIKGALEELTAEPLQSGSLGLFQSSSKALPHERISVVQSGWTPNLRVRLVGATRGQKAHYDFDLTIQVAGTQRLSLAPVGDLTDIALASTWPSPLFAGRFLPQKPQVGPSGFTATWSLSSLAAATQQQILTGNGEIDKLEVSLLTTVDPYKLSDRATKYGILFVLLTFAGFFLFEMLKQLPIHPIQYLLVGVCLAIFFLLLVSLSEHMVFAQAYLLASLGCIGLLTIYLSAVLRSPSRGLGFGAMLAALYAAVYGLLSSEDNALLLGSLLVFALLAAVMVATRNVDWYKQGAELAAKTAKEADRAAGETQGSNQ